MKKYLFSVMALGLFWGCEDEEVVRIPEGNYLPLQVGNYWRLEDLPRGSFVEEKEVTGTTVIDGREYFVLTTTYTGQQQSTSEAVFYRINDSGDVFEKRAGVEKEQLVFRLAALINEAWYYEDTDRRKIRYTGLQSVTLDNSTLDSCKIFYSDSTIPNLIDDEVSVLLAPEVGFVLISASGGSTRTLTKAIINGTTYQF